MARRTYLTLEQRPEIFWSRVNKTDDHWLWTGALSPKGYGLFWIEDNNRRAHNVSWYLTHGMHPEFELDHVCKIKSCVNPAHLEDVIQSVNVRRSRGWTLQDGIWYCPRNHKVLREGKGSNKCLECAKERNDKWLTQSPY